MVRQRDESVFEIKGFCFFVDCVNQNGEYADRSGDIKRALERVPEKPGTDTSSLKRDVDGELCDAKGGNGISGEFCLYSVGKKGRFELGAGEGYISRNGLRFVDGDEGFANQQFIILQRVLFEIGIEFGIAAIKRAFLKLP